MKKLLFSTLTAASLLADTTELETLKVQMAQMQQMMRTMQEKINTLENAKPSASPIAAVSHKERDASSIIGQNIKKVASNLDISLILDASFVNRSKKEEEITVLGTPGFVQSPITESPYNPSNGFNLNYAEMAIHSTVDPYLDADVVFHFSETGVEIEEGYFTSRKLPYNLRIRGGKILSEFGRINAQHHHAWNFSDMPLIYRSLLGHEKLKENGVQLQWVAPTEPYLMIGMEALQGSNPGSFGHTTVTNPNNGATLASSTGEPSLAVGYIKTSADIGNTTLLAGTSIARGESRINFTNTVPAFSGKSTIYGFDLTLKHYFDSYSSLSWQSEWLYRNMDGTQFMDNGTVTTNTSSKKQAGYYSELVYAPNQTWRVGTRYDAIYQNNVLLDGINQNMPDTMEQLSAMIEYHTSEYARYRLQYTHSNALFDSASERQNLDSILFSINLAIGKHAAHTF